MRIEFKISEQQYLEATLNSAWKPENVKGMKSLGVLIGLIMGLLVGFGVHPLSQIPYMELLVGAIGAAIGWLVLPIYWKRFIVRSSKKAYASNTELGMPRVVEIRPEGIYGETAYVTENRIWKGVGRLVETDNLLLLYTISDREAYIFPKECFVGPITLDTFKNELFKYYTPPAEANLDQHLIAGK